MRVLIQTSVLEDTLKAAVNGTLYADDKPSEAYGPEDLKQILSIPNLNWFVEGIGQVRRHLEKVFPEKYPARRLQLAVDRIEVSNELEFAPKSWWPQWSRVARSACVFFSEGERVLYITKRATRTIETFFEEIAHCMDVHHDLKDIPKYFPEYAEATYSEIATANWKRRHGTEPKQLGLPIRCEFDIHKARQSFLQEMRSIGKAIDFFGENRSRLVIQNGELVCRERKSPGCCSCKAFRPKSK